MKVGVIVPAAGAGRRMGGVRKALLEIGGKPLLQYSIDVLRQHAAVQHIVIAVSAADLDKLPAQERVAYVPGGAERADSVRAGLAAMPAGIDVVLVHDAARPLITRELIDRVLAPVHEGRSATLALQATDTLHEVDGDLDITATPDRTRFWRAQTPQAFPREILEQAFARVQDSSRATDEAALVVAGGWPVVVVPGEPWNLKITTPDDVALAEFWLRHRR